MSYYDEDNDLYYATPPDESDDVLEHFGIKGMKWGKHKKKFKKFFNDLGKEVNSRLDTTKKYLENEAPKAAKKIAKTAKKVGTKAGKHLEKHAKTTLKAIKKFQKENNIYAIQKRREDAENRKLKAHVQYLNDSQKHAKARADMKKHRAAEQKSSQRYEQNKRLSEASRKHRNMQANSGNKLWKTMNKSEKTDTKTTRSGPFGLRKTTTYGQNSNRVKRIQNAITAQTISNNLKKRRSSDSASNTRYKQRYNHPGNQYQKEYANRTRSKGEQKANRGKYAQQYANRVSSEGRALANRGKYAKEYADRVASDGRMGANMGSGNRYAREYANQVSTTGRRKATAGTGNTYQRQYANSQRSRYKRNNARRRSGGRTSY